MLHHQRLRAVLPLGGLGRIDRLVLVGIVSFMGDDESCCPSVEMLSDATGISTRRLKDHLKALVEQGIVLRCPRGPNRSSEYRIAWSEIPGERRAERRD
jgi:hypothetical protein